MEDLRIAIIGAGFMSQAAHIHCFQLAQGARVIGLASGRSKLREAVASRFSIPQEYDSWQEVAADPEIDAAVVSLPPEFNPDVVCGLLEAGKHVFAEKPMALSLRQAQRMADAADAAGRILMMGFMKRYDTGVERAKRFWDETVATGEMGALICGRVWCLLGGNWTANQHLIVPILRTDEPQATKPVADLGPDWLPEELGRGVLGFESLFYAFNHVHSHNVNLLRYFMGDDYEVTWADLRHRTKVANLRYGDALITFEVGGTTSAYGFEEGMEFHFEGGWMEILTPPPLLMQGAAHVRIYRGGHMMELSQPMGDWDWSFRRQAQHFVDCVRAGCQPLSSGADSVGDLAMVEAIFRRAVEAEAF
ncbi:MAG: Gfo/Idh/MocA family oxidoreductase [Armatimonadetes bacterium]|nr:Gfo/Idh/MocA family oxidoreductase [Armatimonadota bacterium]